MDTKTKKSWFENFQEKFNLKRNHEDEVREKIYNESYGPLLQILPEYNSRMDDVEMAFCLLAPELGVQSRDAHVELHLDKPVWFKNDVGLQEQILKIGAKRLNISAPHEFHVVCYASNNREVLDLMSKIEPHTLVFEQKFGKNYLNGVIAVQEALMNAVEIK